MFRTAQSRFGSRRRQGGITTLGFIILATFLGLFAFAAIRLIPVYLNYMKVVGVVDGVHQEFDGQRVTRAEIRRSVSRRFDIESVSEITAREVKITAVEGGYKVTAEYNHTVPYIANVSFTVQFDKTRQLSR